MDKMPSLLKWIIGLMLFGVAMQLGLIGIYGGSESAVVSRILGIVITIGVAKGIATGSQVAWHLGRILYLLSLVLSGFVAMTALFAQLHGVSPLTVFFWISIALSQSAFIFFALGARDVRMFCGIEIKKERSPTQI